MSHNGSASHINVCVVGCGHWGKNLARNFSLLDRLYGLCESDPERLRGLAEQYPAAKLFGDLASALEDPDVTAVALATPAEDHHRMAMAALQAGKDVFVEKPLTLDWKDGLEMVEAAHQRGRILMVGHLLRYHPAILKVQELVARESFGKIEYIYSNRLVWARSDGRRTPFGVLRRTISR